MDLGSDVDHCGILTAIVQVEMWRNAMSPQVATGRGSPAQDNTWSL